MIQAPKEREACLDVGLQDLFLCKDKKNRRASPQGKAGSGNGRGKSGTWRLAMFISLWLVVALRGERAEMSDSRPRALIRDRGGFGA